MTRQLNTLVVLSLLALVYSLFLIGCSNEATTDPLNNNTRGNQSGFKWEYDVTVNVNGQNAPLETAVNIGDVVKVTYVLKNISGTFPQVTVWQDGKEVVKKTNVNQGKTLSYTYTVDTKTLKAKATSVIEFIDRADNKNQRFVFDNQPTVSIAVVEVQEEVESFNLTQIEANINKFFEEAQKWFDEMVVKTGESRIYNHPSQGVINIHDLTLRLNEKFGHSYGMTTGHILCNDIEGNFYHLVVHPGYTGYSKNAIQIEYTQYNPRLELTKAYIYELGAVCATIGCTSVVNEASELCEDCIAPAVVTYPLVLVTYVLDNLPVPAQNPLELTTLTARGAISKDRRITAKFADVYVGQVLDVDFWQSAYAAYAQFAKGGTGGAFLSADVVENNILGWFTGRGASISAVVEGATPNFVITEEMIRPIHDGTLEIWLHPLVKTSYPVQLITSSKHAGATVGIHPFTTRPHTNGTANGTFSGNVNGFNLKVRVGDVLDRNFWDAVYAAYAASSATFSSDVTPNNVTLWWTSNGFGWEGNYPVVEVTEAMLGANKTVLYLNPLLDIIKITRPIIDSELIDWARKAQEWYRGQETFTQLTNNHISSIITFINSDPSFDRGSRLGYNDKGRWSFRLTGSSLTSRQLTMVIYFENPVNELLELQGMACYVDISGDDARIFIAEPRFNSGQLPW